MEFKKTIILFGGTGFIGLKVAKYLNDLGFNIVLIARNKPVNKQFDFYQWDGEKPDTWIEVLNNAYAVINLAGRSVDCIKSPENIDQIWRSRIQSTKLIGLALIKVKNPPRVWLQMSTAHIYGDSLTNICNESSTLGYGLAPDVARAWESVFKQVKPKGVRGVIMRTSFVIDKEGGAMVKLKRLVSLGLGGKTGNGKQGISWIHILDFNRIIYQFLENPKFYGVYNISSPNPVQNKDFMRLLREQKNALVGLSLPSWLTTLGARFVFKTDPELALYGRFVKSERLEKQGFTFYFPTIKKALQDVVHNTSSKQL